MWRHVLAGLGRHANIETRERAPRFRFGRGPDVWLADGHTPPPDTGGAPLVIQLHEASWIDPDLAHYLHPDFARAIAAATEASLQAAAQVITPSKASAAQITKCKAPFTGSDPVKGALQGQTLSGLFDTGGVHVVPHGVDLQLFRPGIAGGRERVGSPYVLFAGVLHPRKNLDALRQAIAGVARAGLPHVLVVVGSAPADRPDSRDLVAAATAEIPGAPGRLMRIENPSDEELAALMAGADAVCLPSWFEGFGLPALEAMACGVPVVVSDRGALPEVVADAGIVTTPAADAIEAALLRVLTEPELARDLRVRARARAETMPWSRTVERWLAVIDSCR
jgi:glycosyltransferase involved in cell wall biosynthesis